MVVVAQTMRRWQALPCLVVLLVILVSSDASTLDHMCKFVAATNKDIGYDYCIKFFQADKASATADNRGLGDIATKLSRAAASDTLKRLDTLMASEGDQKIHARLSDCRVLYSAAVNLLKVATNLNAVISDTETCENGFRVLGVTSPLAAEDAVFTKDCSIALIITSTFW